MTNKIKQMIDTIAADNLVPTSICVVTYSPLTGLQLWWTIKKIDGATPSILASIMLSEISFRSGFPIATEGKAQLINITMDVHFDKHFALVYGDFIDLIEDRYINVDEAKVLIGNIIKKKELNNKYDIITKYHIDNQVFDDKVDARKHRKIIQIFDAFNEVGDLDYQVFESVIADMVDNPQKYIDILQGNK